MSETIKLLTELMKYENLCVSDDYTEGLIMTEMSVPIDVVFDAFNKSLIWCTGGVFFNLAFRISQKGKDLLLKQLS